MWQLRHGLSMCAIQMGKTKYWSVVEPGMVVGARRTGLRVSRTSSLQGFSCSTVSRVYQKWFTTQRASSQLDTTVGSIGVNMGQHPCGTLSTPCRVHVSDELRLFWGQKGMQLNTRKVFLMFCTLSVDLNLYLLQWLCVSTLYFEDSIWSGVGNMPMWIYVLNVPLKWMISFNGIFTSVFYLNVHIH